MIINKNNFFIIRCPSMHPMEHAQCCQIMKFHACKINDFTVVKNKTIDDYFITRCPSMRPMARWSCGLVTYFTVMKNKTIDDYFLPDARACVQWQGEASVRWPTSSEEQNHSGQAPSPGVRHPSHSEPGREENDLPGENEFVLMPPPLFSRKTHI